jgi:hypothetical protein
MFLLLVFLNFLFDDGKDTHWFHWLESRLANLANVPAMSVFVAMIALLIMVSLVNVETKLVVTLAGIWGIVVYVGVQALGHILESSQAEETVDNESKATGASSTIVKAGIGGFIFRST